MKLLVETLAYLLALIALFAAAFLGGQALLSDKTEADQSMTAPAVIAQAAAKPASPVPSLPDPAPRDTAFPIGPAIVHVMPDGSPPSAAAQARRKARELSVANEQSKAKSLRRKVRAHVRRRGPGDFQAFGYAGVPRPAFDRAVGW